MDELFRQIPSLLAQGFTFIVIAPLFWWKADDLVSKDAREELVKAVSGGATADTRQALDGLRDMLDAYLPWRKAISTYLIRVLLISFLSTLSVGIIYFSKTGGFWIQFTSGEQARNNFLSQLLLDGFLKIFLVNAIGLLPHSYYVGRLTSSGAIACLGYLAFDIVTREILFIALSAVIWVGFAFAFGSFAGSAQMAFEALLPTFVNAGYFRNLTSVYVYAVAASSLPLLIGVLARVLGITPTSRRIVKVLLFVLPWKEKPVRSLALLAAVLMTLFAMLGSALLSPLSHG
ncbi:hypothetical protein [Novosphingobium sp. 9U]|uniref:hypothetical protein n=1 Tax=Novosphingobium sp. 9U TaxID=2653158 RepID=UPI0013594F94|nr:hypothetical protein [Novosphingobium sp. 9U]